MYSSEINLEVNFENWGLFILYLILILFFIFIYFKINEC